jgi:hypothetical protein
MAFKRSQVEYFIGPHKSQKNEKKNENPNVRNRNVDAI